MKTIVTETALKTNFWSAAIRTAAYFLGNGFTVPQPRPLLKYRNEILQPPLRFSAHIMEGRVKILETYPKSEEIISFYSIFSSIYRLL